MNKYFGKIGFAITEETRPGIWKEKIIEREYYGDIIKDYSHRNYGEGLNDNITLSNQFSILADPYAYSNYSEMKYIEFMGTKWRISGVEVKYPRLIITTGGIYND